MWILDLEGIGLLRGGDHCHVARRLTRRSLDLLVAFVADEDDREAVVGEPSRFGVDLRHQRAGGVDHVQLLASRLLAHLGRDSVGGEDDGRAVRYVVEAVHADRAPAFEL